MPCPLAVARQSISKTFVPLSLSATAECLHSALKIIAAWILHVLVPRPAGMEKQTQSANTVDWWIFVSGEKPIDAANCQESSNI